MLAVSVTETQALNRAETGRALGLASHHLSEKELAPGLGTEAASREQGKEVKRRYFMYAFAYSASYFYVYLSQVGVFQEKQASSEKMLPPDWPLGKFVKHFPV